jgi:hypothetical protein
MYEATKEKMRLLQWDMLMAMGAEKIIPHGFIFSYLGYFVTLPCL